MENMSLHFDKTVTSWDEAVPLGNGDIGCLIWDSADKLRFSIDKCGIWDCSNPPLKRNNLTFDNLKHLVKFHRMKQIAKRYELCYHETTPTKLPTGKIILDLNENGNVESNLDFLTAQAKLTVNKTELYTFIHATENYGLIKINKTNVKFKIENPEFGDINNPPKKENSDGYEQSLKNLLYEKAKCVNEVENDIEYKYFIQKTNDAYYGIVAGKTQKDNETLIAYTVCFSENDLFVEDGKKTIKNALLKGYEKSFIEHKKWWQIYWDKSSIDIPDSLLQNEWYLNNYLLASCSRKGFYPMPLQGVWTADNGNLPPWKGDYHHDLNTQMSYTSYLKANHLEEGECFIDFLLKLKPKAKEFAKDFFNADGICLPPIMDIKGQALGGWAGYSFAPCNHFWLCQLMARYYFFTKNKEYLPKIYDYFVESGKFLLSILKEKNGFYKLPLSTSPEIHDNRYASFLKPNSNYDLALMRCFCMDMIELSREMSKDEEVQKWQDILNKFEPLAITKDGVLKLSPNEKLRESHRHLAHAMAIYPLKTMEYNGENKRIIDATIKDLEHLGRKNWTGYSIGWMAELYISKGDGENAVKQLHDFYNITCSQNGFHLNGDYKNICPDIDLKYRPFTLEGNFLALDAINDLLLYSEHGKIGLFASIPKSWKNASFNSFLAFGGVLVSAKLEDGKIVKAEFEAKEDCEFEILNSLSHLKCNKNINSFKNIILKKGEKLIFE